MTRLIALLRAVNVGGTGTLTMASLRDLAGDLGYSNARTILQSGNLVIDVPAGGAAAAAERLEAALTTRFSLGTDVIVRSPAEWERVVSGNPFASHAAAEPSRTFVMALKGPATPAAVAAIRAVITGGELVEANGAHLYLVYPGGVGQSRLTPARIERALGTRGTARNWNTVLKIRDALSARP